MKILEKEGKKLENYTCLPPKINNKYKHITKKKLNIPHYSVLTKSKILILISFTIRCISIHHVYFHRRDNNLDDNVLINVNILIPNNFLN